MRRSTATTEYLKECMGTALLELMREKPIEKISIEEMTAKADVGRSTYFRYFKNKDEVLSFKLRCMWNAFSQQVSCQVKCNRILKKISRGERQSRHLRGRRFNRATR